MPKKNQKKYVTIQEAAMESILERVDKVLVQRVKKKYLEMEFKLQELHKRAERVDKLLWVVVVVLLVGFVNVIIMAGMLVVDSFHINSVTYKEYSAKINTQNDILENNNFLMEENKKNQKLLKENQDLLLGNQEIVDTLIRRLINKK